MSAKNLFSDFTEEKQEAYSQEARQMYDPKLVDASQRRWNSYSKVQKAAIQAEAEAMYSELVAHMPKGHDSAEVQVVVARWHDQMSLFLEPSNEMLRGLAATYINDERFAAFYRKLHPDMPQFFHDAILYYCDQREQ